MNDLAQGLIRQELLEKLIPVFLSTKRAENRSDGTLDYYRKKITNFHRYCQSQGVTQISHLTPDFLRSFLNHLRDRGNNEGGIHAHYRTLKTFLLWYENEFEPDGWKNPIRKVKVHTPRLDPLEPCNYDDVLSMIKVCGNDLNGRRDKSILTVLPDCGVRASELLAILLSEIDILTGEIYIHKGKGRKSRYVYLGEKSRKSVRQYLKLRTDSSHFLWITDEGDQLSYWGLRSMLNRRATLAGVSCPTIHSFRYYWALNFLRNGGNIFSLRKAGGWESMVVMQRYLKLTDADVEAAMKKYSPVDNL